MTYNVFLVYLRVYENGTPYRIYNNIACDKRNRIAYIN